MLQRLQRNDTYAQIKVFNNNRKKFTVTLWNERGSLIEETS